MSDEFNRVGPLLDITSYPVWAQEMVSECAAAKRSVVEHELFQQMRDAKLSENATRNFFIGIFPVIEQFPQYMALNLLKCQYGRTRGHDAARRYLIRNIRVEQNHADYWVEWAVASGVKKEELLYGDVPLTTHALSHWCWHSCERDSLVASMAATHYAIEGAAGEWATLVCSKDDYENVFEASARKKAMRWLKLHAEYDDTHPWEALEIICTIMGTDPTTRGYNLVRNNVLKSYEYMRLTLDECLKSQVVQRPLLDAPISLSEERLRRKAA
jgi:pyrroloquinoline quinone (PQQ) biosynthesis protein C